MKRHEHRRQRRRQPKYMKAMLAGLNGLAGGKVYRQRIEHDPGCSIFQGGPCDCTPSVGKPKEMRSGH